MSCGEVMDTMSDEELTVFEVVDRLKADGYDVTYTSLSSALASQRLRVPSRVEIRERRGKGKGAVRLVLASSYPEIKAYVERVQKWRERRKSRPKGKWDEPQLTKPKPSEVVEARLQELREKFPDEEYRLEMWIRLLTGKASKSESEEGVAC